MTDRSILYHYPLDPFCRRVRLTLLEKEIPIGLILEKVWERRPLFLEKNPLGTEPLLVEPDGHTLSGANAICEYINEIKTVPNLLGETPRGRAEVRRLTEWFDVKFYRDVYRNIVYEKVHKRFSRGLTPDSKILHNGYNNLAFHLEYLDWLTEQNNYLAGDAFSMADISAAANLSILDYLGDIPWDDYKNAKLWYSKIKSRPSFKDILKDHIKGILPAHHYANLDF